MSQNQQLSKHEDLIRKCDQLVKAGQLTDVSHLISELNMAKIPRSARAGLAKICRRAGLIHQGLKILYPLVREQSGSRAEASALEICEYSALLSRNGSNREALTLLQEVQSSTIQEVPLYTGQCHIINWEYAEAAELFQKYLASDADEYSKLIAKVNLASCFVVTSRWKEALAILEEAVELAEKSGATRLKGNCFELWAQVYFWQNDFEKARQYLQKTSDILGQSQSHDQLLVHKTLAIISALETQNLEPLLKFREQALARQHWISVRETDLFALKVQFDQDKLDHLIFGTPLRPYRERIQNLLQATPSSQYIWGSGKAQILALGSGRIKGAELEPGRKIHQVLACLSKDFYAPQNIGNLFSDLYPEEYFNVDSSPFRVRQLISRTRRWLEENQIPAAIEQDQGSYRFAIQGDFGVQITLESELADPVSLKWQELRRAFTSQDEFSAEEACQHLGCSRASFRRLAEWAQKSGQLEKVGAGKTTRYWLAS